MEEEQNKLNTAIEEARKHYTKESEIWCPYFSSKITLNSDGFNHLLNKPNRMPRNVDEQLLKLRLLKKGLEVIRKAGTVQEYRIRLEKVSKPAKDGFCKTKQVEYWGFQAILGQDKMIKITAIVKKVGDGKLIFWSVMPHKKFNKQKLYTEGIEED